MLIIVYHIFEKKQGVFKKNRENSNFDQKEDSLQNQKPILPRKKRKIFGKNHKIFKKHFHLERESVIIRGGILNHGIRRGRSLYDIS